MKNQKYQDIDYTHGIETVKQGMANGLATQMRFDDEGNPKGLSKAQKAAMIEEAAEYFGKFLEALGCDWENDPNSDNTPFRVAKAYVNDLWVGRYDAPPKITTFPSDGYDGMVVESFIPISSMCSHHHQTISGHCHVAYIPNSQGTVVGLSKLNRLVEYFSRRGSIQEQLTKGLHDAFVKLLDNPLGVAVVINATHNCVKCRGVKHTGASMQTAKLSGYFKEDAAARDELYRHIDNAKSLRS